MKVGMKAAAEAAFAFRAGKRAEDAATRMQPYALWPAGGVSTPKPAVPAGKLRLLEIAAKHCVACLEMAKMLEAPGYFSHDDILAKFRKLGVRLGVK